MNTNKIDLIKDWISKTQDGLIDAQGNFEYPEHEGAYHILCNLDTYIDSLQEEPVRSNIDFEQELYKAFGQVKDFTLGMQIAKRFYDMGKNSQEPVSEGLEEAAKNHAAERYRATRDMVLAEKCKWSFKAGANWQEKKDKETIELAEDHAMLAGIIKGTEHTIGNVRSILNKVACENYGLDVNGDYCEQPYVELDNEFRKLLKEK